MVPAVPKKRPHRYLPAPRCVRLWHEYFLLLRPFECPTLKEISHSCGLSVSTVHRHCVSQSLPLAQSWRKKAP